MSQKLTLKKVIDVVKLSLLLTWFWPPSKDINKFRVVCMTLYHYVSLILHIGLMLGLINTVRNHFNDPVIIVKAIIFVCATMHAICNIVSYRIASHHLQVINIDVFNVDIFYYKTSQKNSISFIIYICFLYDQNVLYTCVFCMKYISSISVSHFRIGKFL